MAIEVTMPKFGLTMHEGTIQRFFKAAGDSVKAGEPLYEVETEKVLYEVEAPASGILAAWMHEEGAIVECGGVVALIAAPGENAAALAARPAGIASGAASRPVSAPVAVAPVGTDGRDGDDGTGAADGRRAVSPVARKLAAQLGVDLARLTGTGPGGRITREDVEQAARHPVSAIAAGTTPPGALASAAPAASSSGADNSASPSEAKPRLRSTPMRGMRRTIAARMHQSLRETAQLTITTEADVSAAVELRARLTREFDFTYTDLLIHAVARALTRHPRMNSRLADDAIISLVEVNIGMAVALDEGLIVPVIRAADRKELRTIAAETKDLGERAKAGKLKIEDVSGGTFTITNLGGFGVDVFTPILNLGETGILGVGRIVEKPAVYRGEIARRSMVALSLTFDHRIIDGAPAAAFLQTVIDVFNYGDR
ncbi:MAG TPA: dihydrolipoamide acetyltransferase family protein [Candidatus Binataceae bacterium]|nr:dihydrolipoamide acetyltransferase family protein [Candidatus Binataceae bacterium]